MEKIFQRRMRLLSVVITSILVLSLFSSCKDDDEELHVTPSQTGTMQDLEGNTYNWIRLGSLDWMAENLKAGTPFYEQTAIDELTGWPGPKFYIEDMEQAIQDYNTFGNYYSYEEAMDNCPEGWRLPTDEDWQNLEIALGMSGNDAQNYGWRKGAAFLMLQTAEQGTGLSLRLGGEISRPLYNIEQNHQYEFGYYWSSTEIIVNGEPSAIIRRVTPGQNSVQRLTAQKNTRWLSVRYVRDAK